MKRKHAGAKSRKHGCSRCGEHKRKVSILSKKAGGLYALCDDCLRATGRGS